LSALTVVAGCVFLSACGGQEQDTAPAAQQPVTEAKAAPKRANNPLANEQQLLKDAKGIQSILDKDAEKKKKALSSAD
jgi:hypothetical protein